MSDRHTLICSAEFPGSDSDSNHSEQSDSARSTPTQVSSSSTGGQTYQTSETFEELPAPEFARRAGALMSLRAGCLASLHHFSDSNAELLTSAGSGPKQPEWLAKFDPVARCSKTRQQFWDSKTGELGMESLTDWPRSGMIVSGRLYPLQSLVQGISGNGYSCSALIPTATATRHGNDTTMHSTDQRNKPNTLGKLMRETFLMPTPTAADGENGGRGDLLAIVSGRPNSHCDWTMPTLRASPNEDRQTKLTPSQQAGKHGLSLAATIHSRLLPTACARDYKDTPNMKRVTEGDRAGPGVPLTRKVYKSLMLPTPLASDNEIGATSDAKSKTAGPGNSERDLPRRIYADESIPKTGGMKMSPEFRCWFMGFPVDWLKPLVESLGTLSSRKSRKSSRAPSTNT